MTDDRDRVSRRLLNEVREWALFVGSAVGIAALTYAVLHPQIFTVWF